MGRFQKAQKQKRKLRLAIFGPSGSGKTFTSLAIASGMGSSIALIDTENYSASLYADQFEFETAPLDNPTVDELIEAMDEAKGFDVLIIDSGSHSWQELLQEIDQLAKTKYKGNTWSAWSEGTPKQKRLVRSLISFPGHIIMTMRSKTEWTTVDSGNGKKSPQRVGLAPEQGKGIEYEFDMLMELSVEHLVQVIKDRTGKYQDKIFEKPGRKLGKELIEWLETGAEPEPTATELAEEIKAIASILSDEEKEPFRETMKKIGKHDVTALKKLLGDMRKRVAELSRDEGDDDNPDVTSEAEPGLF